MMPTMLNQTDLDALLALYEAMAEAARANEWDTLAALEREAAALRDAFRAQGRIESATTVAALTEDEAARLRSRIDRILALDAEIRTHTDPFLASVRKLLADNNRGRAMRDAYGALAP